MGDTPIYTFSHHNGEHTTVEIQHGDHVSLRASGLIVHRVDEDGKRTGRTVFPYASMKSYHIEYPDTCPEHGSLTACRAAGKHSNDAPVFRIGGPTDGYGAPVPIPANGILRTPAEWSEIEGIMVMDPDGWRQSFRTATLNYTAQSWDEPVSHDEWQDRMAVSSCIKTPPKSASEVLAEKVKEYKESNAEPGITAGFTGNDYSIRGVGGFFGGVAVPREGSARQLWKDGGGQPWEDRPEVVGSGDVPEREADGDGRTGGHPALGPE